MKKHLSKRLLSLFLAVLMVATSAPLAAFAAGTAWTQVASSDFTQAEWRKNSDGNVVTDDVGSSFRQYVDNVPALNDSDSTMSWTVNGYDGSSIHANEGGYNGVHYDDGFIFLNAYNGDQVTPITGAESFKIDLLFTHTSYDISMSSRYGFFMLGKTNALSKPEASMDSNSYVFAQDGDGPAWSEGVQLYSNGDDGYNLSSNSGILTVGQDYHYILTYSDGYFHAYITDTNGKTVQNLFSAEHAINTSEIVSIIMGDDDSSYFSQDMNYKSITFYRGTEDKSSSETASGLTKYLFAYFTGNSADDEQIHLAVSDDGLNFEALNGNRPIFENQTASASYPQGNGIPAGGSGIASSGHARDPYILRGEDGSYYILATDLDTQNGTNWANNSKLLVWHVEDLADLENAELWNIDMEDVFVSDSNSVTRAWAPQAIWDPTYGENGAYMLYWSNKMSDTASTSLYYMYTEDFKTFLTQPQLLIANTSMSSTYDTIDGDITYDESSNLFYLFYKNDNEDQIYYATSPNVNGPYSGTNHFYDSDLSALEGPQIYKLLSDDSYVFLADTYGNPRFAVFGGTDIEHLDSGRITNSNISHLRTRHGSVAYITDDDYNALADKYGKETYDSTAIKTGENVNDTLVGRYFTNSDPTYDAASVNGSNTLTNSGVQMVSDYNGKVAARFQSTASDNASGNKAGSYAFLDNTSELLAGLDYKTGVTFSWYGYGLSANAGRYFDWSTADEGSVVWDGAISQNNTSYAYTDSKMEFGVNNNGSTTLLEGYEGNGYINAWHLYTMTITDSYFHFFIDGQLLRTIYSKDMASITTQGTPSELNTINEEWFNRMVSANLYFGISSYAADNMLDGYISDFRIYNRALSASDIQSSLDTLDQGTTDTPADSSQRVYFDPFEDTTSEDGSVTYYRYDQTVEDPLTIHGDVLSLGAASGAGVESQYAYSGGNENSGFTISMFYNPGSGISGENIFTVGTSSNAYFELLENGELHFNWNGSSINITDAFGSNQLTADSWNHIVVQVEPSADYDIIYTYINGANVGKFNTYTASDSNLTAGASIHEYLSQANSISYGKTAGSYANATEGYLDSFAIYNGIYSASDIFSKDSLDSADSLLGETMKLFENRMATISSDNIYTNMATAYEIYDKAKRYQWSINNGTIEMKAEEVTELFTQMNEALNAMNSYSGPATIEGWSTTNNTQIGAQYTQNMLSKVNLDSLSQMPGTEDNYNAGIASGSFVWLYDGSEMTAPINAGIYRNADWTTSIYGASIYLTQGDNLSLATNWHFNTNATVANGNQTNPGWYYENYNDELLNSSGEDSNVVVPCSSGNWVLGSNYLVYNVSNTPTNYLTTINPHYNTKNYWTSLGRGFVNHDIVFDAPIYIINYVPVENALFNNEERIAYLQNITNYRPDTAKELLGAYDALTEMNYQFDVNNENGGVNNSNVETFVNKLSAAVSRLEAVDTTDLTGIADYQPLISKRDEYKDEYTALVEGEKDLCTTSSWQAFDNAYNAVVEHFNSLYPYGEDQPFVTDENVIKRLTNNIDDAYATLVRKADYEPVDSKVAEGTEYTVKNNTNNGTNLDNQIYTYSTYEPFKTAYAAAKTISSNTDEYKNNIPMYYVSYQPTDPSQGEYGPYIAFDKNGRVVTNNTQDTDYYAYIGTYYDRNEDGSYSENYLEEGDYIYYNGSYINVRNYRYYAESVSTRILSSKQIEINTASSDLETANAGTLPVVDYTAYNATTDLLKYQDIAAFTDAYIGTLESSVYSIIRNQGTQDSSVTYASGLEGVSSITCTTLPYSSGSGEKAYVSAEGRVWKDTSDQNVLDGITRNILQNLKLDNTENISVRRQVEVTFNYVLGDSGSVNEIEKKSINYGDNYLAETPDGYTAYKWVIRENESGETFTVPSAQSYNAKITTPVTITVYCSEEPIENQVTLRVLNQYGHIVQEYNVAADTAITLADNQYTIAENSPVSMPDAPFYRFSGWLVNGTAHENGTVDLSDYTTSVVTLKPVFAVASDSYTITVDNAAVTLENGANIYYDTQVTVKPANGAIGLAADINGNYYAVSYGSEEYSFYACGNINFYSIYESDDGAFTINNNAIEDKELVRKLSLRLPFVYSLQDVNDSNQFFTYSASTANIPEGAEVTEVGTIYTISEDIGNDSNQFVIGAPGVNKNTAKNQLNTMQYYLGINNSRDLKIYTRAYVKYSYKTNVTEGNVSEDTEIQTIDYGNICVSR